MAEPTNAVWAYQTIDEFPDADGVVSFRMSVSPPRRRVTGSVTVDVGDKKYTSGFTGAYQPQTGTFTAKGENTPSTGYGLGVQVAGTADAEDTQGTVDLEFMDVQMTFDWPFAIDAIGAGSAPEAGGDQSDSQEDGDDDLGLREDGDDASDAETGNAVIAAFKKGLKWAKKNPLKTAAGVGGLVWGGNKFFGSN